MIKLVIFGTSEMAKIAHFFFSQSANYEVAGFTVDSSYRDVDTFCGLEVFDFDRIAETHPPSDYQLFIAIGPTRMNMLREEKFLEAKNRGYKLASFVSDKAACYSSVGENCFVADFANIQPFVVLGENTFVWEFALVANDASLGPHSYLAPRVSVSSFASVEKNCVLGTGSIIKTHARVAEFSLVGAGCYIASATVPSGVYGRRQSDFFGAISHKIHIGG